jgi:hypothetical protein
MSQQGTWADAVIVQAVSDALNITIHITESNRRFSPVTIISPVNPKNEPIRINIGHLDEIHYVSTTLSHEQYRRNFNNLGDKLVQYVTNENHNNSHIQTSCATQGEQVTNDSRTDKRRAYMRELMRRKRENNEFRNAENKAQKLTRLNSIEKTGKHRKQTSKKYKEANLEKTRQVNKKAFKKSKENNPEHIRELKRQTFAKSKQNNPEHIRKVNKNVQSRKRRVISDNNDVFQPDSKKQKNHILQQS